MKMTHFSHQSLYTDKRLQKHHRLNTRLLQSNDALQQGRPSQGHQWRTCSKELLRSYCVQFYLFLFILIRCGWHAMNRLHPTQTSRSINTIIEDMGPCQMGTIKTMTTPEIQTFGWTDLFSLLPQLHLLFSSIICTDFLKQGNNRYVNHLPYTPTYKIRCTYSRTIAWPASLPAN